MSITTVRSTCCYCGVGCGVLIETDGARIVGIQGDSEHPANFGRLCTKGLTLPQSCGDAGRALQPELRRQRDAPRSAVAWDTALDFAADRFAAIIREHGPDAVAFYLSGQLLTEDYYVFNKLAKGLIGTANIDTNSRLCMASAVSGYKLAFGVDGPPGCYEDLDHADAVLIAGANMAYAHPVLFRRLEAAKAARPETRWIVIDPRRTDTAALADLHLQIQPGTDVALFNGMLHHLIWERRLDVAAIDAHTEGFDAVKNLVRSYPPKLAAELCGITEAELIQAAEWFGTAKAALSLYSMGLNQSSHGTDKNLALINLHLATGQLGRPGAGPFSLTGQPNAMGGREVGGLATMLASHRELESIEDRAELAAIWGVAQLPNRRGKTAVELFDAVGRGEIKAVWIACTNPAHSLPGLDKVRNALSAAELIVVQDAFVDTDSVPYADLLLPATTWGEKDGVVTNSERRISRVRRAVNAPGDARDDWWIATQFARRLEVRLWPDRETLFAFESSEAVFKEYQRTTMGRDLDIGGLSYARLEAGPTQWPAPAAMPSGTARLYTDQIYATRSGRARFHAVRYQPVAEPISARYPFRLLTGRLRDQWHGMSRTGRIPQLFEHTPEPRLAMHPIDMERRGLVDGSIVELESKRGKLVVAVEKSDEVASGCVFLPMHWSRQFMQGGGSNEVTIPAIDPISFQPELKHAAVRLSRLDLPWTCVAALQGDVHELMKRLRPLLARCRYATLCLSGREASAVVLKAADVVAPERWLQDLDAALEFPAGPDTQDYQDPRQGVFKRMLWREGRLAGLRLVGETAAQNWLLAILSDGVVWSWPRHWAFMPTAKAPSGAPVRERVLCNCHGVTERAIQAACASTPDLASLQTTLKCGTTCGSCLPQLKRILAAARAPV